MYGSMQLLTCRPFCLPLSVSLMVVLALPLLQLQLLTGFTF